MKTRQFILLAPPGVNVQDHAAALAKQWQIPYVSLDALRQEAIAHQSTLASEIAPYLESGEPLPDTPTLKLMRRRFEQPDTVLKGWVLEGFPRTVSQAQGFGDWWAAMGAAPVVVYLKAVTGILINRLSAEPDRDESISAIRQRLETYQADIEPLVEYYQQRGQLKIVNASLSFAEVGRSLARLGQEHVGAAPLIHDEAELNVLIARKPRLVVDCMATWCGSCKRVTPSIDKLAAEYRDRVNVMKIDFDTNRQITKRFGLQGIPAVMFFRDGELLKTLTGVKSYAEYTTALSSLFD